MPANGSFTVVVLRAAIITDVAPAARASVTAGGRPGTTLAMTGTFTLEFDGGSRGNPGPAGIGVVIRAGDGTALVTMGRYIGRATNNVAEYRALIAALTEARKLGARRIVVRGDSELIIRQMRGEYRVKNPDLRDLYEQAREILHEFEAARFEHNLRDRNELADRLANVAMDRKAEVNEIDPMPPPTVASPPVLGAGDRVLCPRCGCQIEVRRASPVRPHQLKSFVCQCGAKMVLGEPSPGGGAEQTRE